MVCGRKETKDLREDPLCHMLTADARFMDGGWLSRRYSPGVGLGFSDRVPFRNETPVKW